MSPTSTWRCHTTPPVSTTTRTTLPRKHGPHGKPPSAGTPAGPTSSQSSGSPKFERSEQQERIDRAHLTLHDAHVEPRAVWAPKMRVQSLRVRDSTRDAQGTFPHAGTGEERLLPPRSTEGAASATSR